MGYESLIVTIRLDKEMFGEFTGIRHDHVKEDVELYLAQHPRAKHPPMDWMGKSRDGLAPSWNTFLNCPSRQIQASWKKQMEEYVNFCLHKQHIKHPYLDKFAVLVVQHKPRATNSDNDNTMIKGVLDELQKEEVIVEDNYKHMIYYASISVVNKEDAHTDIILYPITDEYGIDLVIPYIANDIVELLKEYEL